MVRRVDHDQPWSLLKEFRLYSEGSENHENDIKLNTLSVLLQMLTLSEPQVFHPDSGTQNEPYEIFLL